jgi:hypothetical protein
MRKRSRTGARRPSRALDNLGDLAAMLSVQSLDLRAEYEAKLRILTSIQREIEILRMPASAARQERALAALRHRFNELTAANRDASETLAMIRGAFDRVQGEGRAARPVEPQHA